MYDSDIVAGWFDDKNAKFIINDYYSAEEKPPQLDTLLGGSSDVQILSAAVSGNTTTLIFSRKLNTGFEISLKCDLTKK